MNTKGFSKLSHDGLEKTKPDHHAQVQMYMHWSGLERAYYFCVCKETDMIYGERIKIDKKIVDILRKKAERIIFLEVIPEKLDNFECKFCEHKQICQENKLPLVSCRTCAHSTPLADGTWHCARKNEKIEAVTQRHGCGNHIFIPSLVPLEVTDACEENGTITYGNIINGPGAIASVNLQEFIK